MAPTLASLVQYFRDQAVLCTDYASPFTGQLIARIGEDLEAGGPVADSVGDWNTPPVADALSVRLCGAIHAAVLTGRDPALAAEYPEQRASWNMDSVWPLARAFLARDQDWVAKLIQSPPQTNEVRRSIALLPGFLTLANLYDGPIHTLEIGASAGLNLSWDRFNYQTASWSWGPPGGVRIETEWSGPPPPLTAAPRIESRAGCDLNPLDLSDRAQRLHLRSYIWPDQLERLARFDAAADFAVAIGQKVERANAAEWLEKRLAARARDAATIVYHSVFLQYPPPPVRNAIIATIEAAGASATPEAPLAWLRLEPEAVLGGARDSKHFWVEMITWPGKVRRLLALTDGHVRSVQACEVD